MHAEDLLTITFNGEIYNYLELRSELESKGHRFRSHTDTEVLLRSYLEWGVDCLGKLNGMWAFVIWDRRSKSAFVARDRFGVKPLYYATSRDHVIFASEPKAILSLEPQRKSVDQGTLLTLLVEKRMDIAHRTFYESIASVPAGHYAVVTPDAPAVRPRSYWTIASGAEGTDGVVDTEHELARILEDSVRFRLRSDVRVGLTLSGGLDSTAILEATSQIQPESDLLAFTSVYGDDQAVDERSWAQLAVARHPNVELRTVEADRKHWLRTLADIVWHMDGPGISPAVYPLWEIMRTARASQVPVLLEGQGADELFGGYAAHAAVALMEQVGAALRHPRVRSLAEIKASLARSVSSHSTRRLLVEAANAKLGLSDLAYRRHVGLGRALRPEFVAAAMDHVEPATYPDARTGLDRRLFDDFTRNLLPGFLHYGDAMSMAHSIESRLPFLDYRLVDLAFSLPTDAKIAAGASKAPLRSYLHRVGQHDIANRIDKRGYPTPTSDWLAQGNGAILRDVLLDRSSLIGEYVDPVKLKALIDHHVGGSHRASDPLYALLTTQLWLTACIA